MLHEILAALFVAWLVVQVLSAVTIRESERSLRRLQRRLYSQQVALEIRKIEHVKMFSLAE